MCGGALYEEQHRVGGLMAELGEERNSVPHIMTFFVSFLLC